MANSLLGLADVVKYDEDDFQQKFVTDETFYYRYTYDYTDTSVTVCYLHCS